MADIPPEIQEQLDKVKAAAKAATWRDYALLALGGVSILLYVRQNAMRDEMRLRSRTLREYTDSQFGVRGLRHPDEDEEY